MRTAWLMLDAVGAAGALVFVLMYAIGSAGWHRSQVGRSIMALALSLALLLGMVMVSLAYRMPVPVWLVLLGLLDISLWWRVWILWKAQRRDRADRRVSDLVSRNGS